MQKAPRRSAADERPHPTGLGPGTSTAARLTAPAAVRRLVVDERDWPLGAILDDDPLASPGLRPSSRLTR
jgi:hypothetical protein